MPSTRDRRRMVAVVRAVLGTSAIRAQRSVIAGVVVAVLAGFGVATAATLFTVLHEFTGDGGDGKNPSAVIQGTDGIFYGTTRIGGDTGCFGGGCGTFFRMLPAGAATILHVFNGPTEGANPTALIEAADGNFYGATSSGGGSACGGSGCGTIFKMTPAGVVTVLHVFNGGATDGATPNSPLLQATDGNFYGMTTYGGSTVHCDTTGNAGCGTVFKMTPGGTFTLLHGFVGGATDGEMASSGPGSLLQSADGSFFGTTPRGGGNTACFGGGANQACGTVFKMTPAGDVTILHAFRGGTTDGALPTAMIQGTDGNFYGTTYGGGVFFSLYGCSVGCGTTFKMAPDGTITLLHAFFLDSLGPHPNGLLQTGDGSLYGTTPITCEGRACNFGAVFKMTLAGAIVSLHEFSVNAAGGVSPHALIQGADGSLYGASDYGCFGNNIPPCTLGAVFRLSGLNPTTSDDLVVDFGGSGVWMLFDGNTNEWVQLHAATARNIATGDLDGNGLDEVIVDFGSSYGIWVWANNSSWYQLHRSTSNRMATGDLDGNGRSEVLIDFPGAGIWVWANNTSWYQLHSSSANNVMTADLDGNGMKEAIIDFPGFGIWVRQNNTSWFQLHPLNSRLMTAGDFDGNGQADLVVDFAGYGLWKYSNNSTWSQVHPLNASHLAAGDVDGGGKSDLFVDFGSSYGIWKLLNGTTWSQLHALTSANILTADLGGNGKADVIVNFGAAGLWEYANNTSWVQLHSVSPGVIAVGHLNAPAP